MTSIRELDETYGIVTQFSQMRKQLDGNICDIINVREAYGRQLLMRKEDKLRDEDYADLQKRVKRLKKQLNRILADLENL